MDATYSADAFGLGKKGEIVRLAVGEEVEMEMEMEME